MRYLRWSSFEIIFMPRLVFLPQIQFHLIQFLNVNDMDIIKNPQFISGINEKDLNRLFDVQSSQNQISQVISGVLRKN